MTDDDHRFDDGAYVLGALDDAERAAFEAHLDECAECRARVAELRSTVDLLALADADVAAEPVPDTLLPSLLRRADAERTKARRRRRFVTGGLGAVAAAAVVALVVAVWPARTPVDPPRQQFVAVRANPVEANAQLVDKPWGTQIDVRCRYENVGNAKVPYRLVVVADDRHRYYAGGWTLAGDTTHFVGGAEVRRAHIAKVLITLGDGEPILQLSP